MSFALSTRRSVLMPGAWARNELWRRARAAPSLDLRFADNKSLVDANTGQNLVTFTRASSGTYVGSDGLVKTAATNEPRFDHNPTTGESLGLLVEEQRTNSIRNNTMVGAVAGTPGTLPTNWSIVFNTTTGITREIVGTGTESGITYIDIRFSGTATGAGSLDVFMDTSLGVAGLTGQTWAGSVYWSLAAGTFSGLSSPIFYLYEYASSSAFVNAQGFGAPPTPTSGNLISKRFKGSVTTAGGATTAYVRPIIKVNIANGATIDATLRIGLPQLELGAFATSVIATSGTAATRSADVCSISGSNFSSWYRQDEGTLYGQGVIANTNSNRFLVAASDATIQEEIALYENTSFNSLVIDNNVSQGNSFGGTVTAGSELRHGFAYKLNDLQGYGSGIALSADTSATLPTVDRLTIGSRVNSTFWLNGTIRRLSFWPTRLPNSTLQTITQS